MLKFRRDQEPRECAGAGKRWLVWLLSLCVILLGCYLYQVVQCARFIPTGDPLYDRYARTVIQRQAWLLFTGGGGNPATLPDKLLANWEPEFGDDPRYWQLRAWCEFHRDHNYTSADFSMQAGSLSNYAPAVAHLEEAWTRGVVDADTLFPLFFSHARDWAREIDRLADEYADCDSDSGRQEILAGISAVEDREQAWLTRIITAAPDDAWPYYLRARYWSFNGEVDQALADFMSGNDAAVNCRPKVFPASFVLDLKEDGKSAGSSYLSGAILQAETFELPPNWIRWKDCGKQFMCAAALSGDSAYLTEYHRFACRVGKAERANLLEPLVAAILARMLADYTLAELGSELDTEQHRTLVQGYKYCVSLHDEIQKHTQASQERNLGFGLLDRQKLGTNTIFGSSDLYGYLDQRRTPLHRLSGWLQYIELHIPWRSVIITDKLVDEETRFRRNELVPYLYDLEFLDYGSLEFPERWQEGNRGM